jgi:hypothetical protein
MRAHGVPILGLTLLLAAACAATAPPRTDFADVPVPEGLAFQPDRSATIESVKVKAARHVYRTRFEPDSLATLIRSTLEGSGWRYLSGTSTAANGAVQVYQKGNDTLHVRVWEGGLFNWYTYVEYAAARVAPGALSASTK